jgi:hypothetical protein
VYKKTGFVYSFKLSDHSLFVSPNPLKKDLISFPFTETRVKGTFLTHPSVDLFFEQQQEMMEKEKQEEQKLAEIERKKHELELQLLQRKRKIEELAHRWRYAYMKKLKEEEEVRLFQRFFYVNEFHFKKILEETVGQKTFLQVRDWFRIMFSKCLANYYEFSHFKVKKDDYTGLVLKKMIDFDDYCDVSFLERQKGSFFFSLKTQGFKQRRIETISEYSQTYFQPFLNDIKIGVLNIEDLPFDFFRFFDLHTFQFRSYSLGSFYKTLDKLIEKHFFGSASQLDMFIRNMMNKNKQLRS